MLIRTTEPADREAVLDLVRAAFGTRGRDGSEEVGIVQTTWDRGSAPPGFDIVALEDGRVVGHVLGARGRLGSREALGLAPLAVVPDRQRQGIGSALVKELLTRAEDAGWPFVLLLGSPVYYGRFGFEPAGPLGMVYPPVGEGNPDFQVRRLAGYDDSWRGEFAYCWEL